jgi:hypothetical protein
VLRLTDFPIRLIFTQWGWLNLKNDCLSSYSLYLKSPDVYKGMSCWQASFVGFTYILKYATEHLLGDIKNFLSKVFYQFLCFLQIIGKSLSFSILHMSLHPCPIVLYAQKWLHAADFFTLEVWGTWVSGDFQWKFQGHLWRDEFFMYVLINMFNTTVCDNIDFIQLPRKTIWFVISCVWLTGRGCDIHAFAEIVLAIHL